MRLPRIIRYVWTAFGHPFWVGTVGIAFGAIYALELQRDVGRAIGIDCARKVQQVTKEESPSIYLDLPEELLGPTGLGIEAGANDARRKRRLHNAVAANHTLCVDGLRSSLFWWGQSESPGASTP